MDKKFSTYSVIPTEVILNKNLSSTSKLVYGLISSLTNEKGYCWASNKYIGDLLGISSTRISLIIKELVSNNLIESNIKDNCKREIKLKGVLTFVKGGYKEKLKGGVLIKVKDNNININNNIINNISEQSSQNEINLILNEFKELNPLINFGNKTERKAIDDLLKEFSFEKLIAMLKWYKTKLNDQFCPVATSPSAFIRKLGDIKIYAEKKKGNSIEARTF